MRQPRLQRLDIQHIAFDNAYATCMAPKLQPARVAKIERQLGIRFLKELVNRHTCDLAIAPRIKTFIARCSYCGSSYLSMAASSAGDNGAPLISIIAKASLISLRSSDVSVTSAARRFSSRCSTFVAPGIGTIQGFRARIHASAI